MADENQQAPGEQPAPTNAETTPNAGEQPQAPSAPMDILSGMNDVASLMAIVQAAESAEPKAPVEDVAPAPIVETPPVTSGEQPTPEFVEEAAPAAVPTKPNAEAIRLRMSGIPREQQTLAVEATRMVRDGEAPDLLTAMKALSGEAPQAQAPAADQNGNTAPVEAAPQTPPTAPAAEAVTQIQAKITDLRSQRKDAVLAYDKEKEIELTDQLEDLNVELAEARTNARLDAQNASQARSSYHDQYQAACDEVATRYPDVDNEASPFSIVLTNAIDAAKANGDPMIADPNFITSLADRVAGLVGVKASDQQVAGNPVTTPAAPVALPQVPPRQGARPTGESVASGHPSQGRPSVEQVKTALNTASKDELAAALFTE